MPLASIHHVSGEATTDGPATSLGVSVAIFGSAVHVPLVANPSVLVPRHRNFQATVVEGRHAPSETTQMVVTPFRLATFSEYHAAGVAPRGMLRHGAEGDAVSGAARRKRPEPAPAGSLATPYRLPSTTVSSSTLRGPPDISATVGVAFAPEMRTALPVPWERLPVCRPTKSLVGSPGARAIERT